MNQHEMIIDPAPNLRAASERFLDDIGNWIASCIDENQEVPPTDGHDQGTFTTSWGSWIKRRDNGRALAFMSSLRDSIKAHFEGSASWHHGYWAQQEVHHGTEHFELFLGSLWQLNPTDEATAEQLLDAAEHIGNWVDGVPAWFDWDTTLFRSTHLGTRRVQQGPGFGINVPDHLRCINLCLLAHRIKGDTRYLELASNYTLRWATAINEAEQLPLGLTEAGWIVALSSAEEKVYRGFVKQLSDFSSPVDRAENILASNGIDTLLALWVITSEAVYRDAAQRLLDQLATQLNDPDAGPAADAIRRYRRLTGDTRYDDGVLETLESLDPGGFERLALAPTVRRSRRPPGIGKRKDMPAWFEDGRPRKHNPIFLALAADVTGDPMLAKRSLELGRGYFCLARQAFPSGRHHGCSARSVSAVARGHGRDNNAGVVTAVLDAVISGPLFAEMRKINE